IYPATWSFMLAARSRGLGSAWTSLHLFFEQEAAAVLGIPYADVLQTALIPVAYTKGTDFGPAPRDPLSSLLHWDTWYKDAAATFAKATDRVEWDAWRKKRRDVRFFGQSWPKVRSEKDCVSARQYVELSSRGGGERRIRSEPSGANQGAYCRIVPRSPTAQT